MVIRVIRSRSPSPQLLVLLLLGFALRLVGLLFKGTHDLDQLVLEWGASVTQNGLGHTPIVIYGILSYAFHGMGFFFAESVPRFWWAPQKFLELLAEAGILATLFQLLPRCRRQAAIWFYWLNPFFILSGGWDGFWDAPHTLTALLAVLVIRNRGSTRTGWLSAGALLAAGAMFKPQGLIYFILPLVLYLVFDALARRRLSYLVWLGAGGLATYLAAEVCLIMIGGHPMAIPRSYLIGDIMPNLCNSCISIWRPVTRMLQVLLRQPGALYELRLPGPTGQVLDKLILVMTIVLVARFCLRVASVGAPFSNDGRGRMVIVMKLLRATGLGALSIAALGLLHSSDPLMHAHLVAGRYSAGYAGILGILAMIGVVLVSAGQFLARQIERLLSLMASTRQTNGESDRDGLPPYLSVYLVFAFGALVVPQLGTRAHINHTYGGLVFLIPLAVVNRSLWMPWITMVGVHLYGYLSSYGLGIPTALPTRDISAYPQAAQQLVARIDPASYGVLLRFQGGAAQLLRGIFPQEPVLSILSVVQFVCVIFVVREFFGHLGRIERLAVEVASSSTS